jgi:hypothetical protein
MDRGARPVSGFDKLIKAWTSLAGTFLRDPGAEAEHRIQSDCISGLRGAVDELPLERGTVVAETICQMAQGKPVLAMLAAANRHSIDVWYLDQVVVSIRGRGEPVGCVLDEEMT